MELTDAQQLAIERIRRAAAEARVGQLEELLFQAKARLSSSDEDRAEALDAAEMADERATFAEARAAAAERELRRIRFEGGNVPQS